MATALAVAARKRAQKRNSTPRPLEAAPSRKQRKGLPAAQAIARKATKQGTTAGYTFKGSGRSAAYRGAAGVVLRSGGGELNADRAGRLADQSYFG